MSVLELVEKLESRGLHLSLNSSGGLKIQGPRSALTSDLTTQIKKQKQQLIDALHDRHEAIEERAAILEYDNGVDKKEAERIAKKIKFVSCHRCLHWENVSPCKAGVITSGPYNNMEIRICIHFQAKQNQSA